MKTALFGLCIFAAIAMIHGMPASGQDGNDEPPCLIPIPMIYAPVCGSDGEVYSNSYQLEAQNTCYGKNIKVVDSSRCRNFPDVYGR
ncbi:unnamed protein product [Notodromas monacha]|uniref:Kazal-like domain-containing protein n=1 Tax=Notodromas monacha TaxID=399045 RepID=A0A7R9BYT7_9CRUS|nr:unnamed protein product [Notodromas monacha]CAG0923177.1 unnamed protein product [Notodromas monacha]